MQYFIVFFWTEPLIQCNMPLISVVADGQLHFSLSFTWFALVFCWKCEFNSHNWKSVYLHPRLLQNDPKLKAGSVRDDSSWIGLSQELLLRFIQRKACKAALYIHHVNSKNKYEYDSILCKSYEMDSQEEYLFCKSKKNNVRVQFKRRRPRQSLWFAMKELYSIFAGFCCFRLISFLIHYRWPVHILCFGCIVFLCFLRCLSAMDELYSM